MFGPGRELLGRARAQVREDLRADPFLPYIIVLATLLASFWFWHRVPNFATRDEKDRLIDAMVPYGRVLADPSFESLRNGVTWSRVPFGATLYLFALAMLPVVVVAVLTGRADIFTSVGFPNPAFGYYDLWAATPRWVWTWSLVFVRLFNVAFAVGSVYLTYRLGTAIVDRLTGRLAAVILTLTFGFLTIAHEGGEDMPALFCALLSLNLLYVYVRSGERTPFFAGAVFGGAAIAFKLTAAPVILGVGIAHLLRALRTEDDTVATLLAPRLLVTGAALGLVTILLGFPTFLVGGFEQISARIFGGSMSRMSHPTGPDAPITWWFLRGYFSGMGLPLFFASVAGVVGSAVGLRKRREGRYGVALVLAMLAVYVAMFSQWHDFRVHHLLPTLPLFALLLANSLSALREWNPAVARPVMAVLLVTTAVYAGLGTAGFASMPRDQAEAWLAENADENETVEVYRVNIQDIAVPHGMKVNHRFQDRASVDPCPEYIQLGYRDLLYLKEGTYYRNGETQKRYIRGLLEGEYDYELVAEFGERPPNFVPERATPGDYTDLLRYGVVPQTDQFADEQELAANQYTAILERTERCTSRHESGF
ncbi:glycosyltransferase family 39 protein [Haloarcula sp. S1CR25-12]|uniref:Glycosyltransferase family 39 protein n=1 Tax=Haloarcula saliterrae TaxID=2950534 RepID=A0ABU2FIG6_9EURY|nr:glycosyltransferase family 39 protein [Haloarcula sp. S1CR25-12]MDS0261500.1 glycosyltransferase family 39 protein [Haloarcula sp. S1CR25-12]